MKVPVVGHRKVLSSIPNPLPQTLLLTGPEGVGKRLVAQLFAVASGTNGLDFQNLGHLDRAKAALLLAHHESHPLQSPVKTSIADLTRSSPEAMNSILKLLEEPPAYSRIILHTDRTPLLTIRPRCFNVAFGVLSEDEVVEVLRTRTSVPEYTVEPSARASEGRVSVALDYARQYPSRKHVEAVLAAVCEGRGPALDEALSAALEAGEREPAEVLFKRREVVASLLARSLRFSLTHPDHVLAQIDEGRRVEALRILESASRAVLKVRSAAWVLAG